MGSEAELNIKLVVAGESRERALDLVRKMEASQRFHQTRIDQERAELGQAAGDNVQFDISAVYVPEVQSTSKGGAP